MTPSPPVLDALPVQLRLIQRAATGTAVLGATLAAQAPLGVNGDQGYQSGTFEAALSEQGTMAITLPNSAGADGRLHRTRFDCLTDSTYNQGDEWIEVWHGVAGRGRLLFVGTPTDWRVSRTTITLTLADGTGLLELQRETAAGFWQHAPRDVFEHYTKAWRTLVADDFVTLDAVKWTTTGTAVSPGVRLAPAAINTSVTLVPVSAQWEGVVAQPLVANSCRAWRAEMTYNRSLLAADLAMLQMRSDNNANTVELLVSGAVTQLTLYDDAGILYDSVRLTVNRDLVKLGATLALECRDRWMLAYVDGALATSIEWDSAGSGNYRPRAVMSSGGVVGGSITVDSILLRKAELYLMRRPVGFGTTGDYRLPGTLPSGGLRAAYFDEADLRALGDTTAAYYRRAMAPSRDPYARRQDTQVNFATATPPAWQAAGVVNGEYFSVRWTGAIYLDLAAADVFLRLTNLDNAARLWVGKTMYAEHCVGQWVNPVGAPFTLTSNGMRTHLGTSVSGWYPLRLEYAQGAGAGGIILQQSTTGVGGTYAAIPATLLSPYGIYEADVRYDSHAEQLKAIVNTFGLQYRCEPRSLESGSFPGEAVPKIRVGRDTDKILTPSESTEVELSGSAQDTVQTLLADAAGLADPSNAAQLTSEAVSFTSVFPAAVADRHMMVATGYESLADITDPALLATRLAAMLGLRLSPWEEIGARPRGARELRDTFPLTGALALFAWEPGDGVRIVDDQLGFADASPRQIIAPSWPFGPDGLGAPSVRFRQRPRSQQDALRDLVRAVLLPQRNYQGQLATLTGTWSDVGGGYTRIPLPDDMSDVVKATLVVGYKSDASAWTVNIPVAPTATGILTFYTAGRYDLTPYVVARTDGYASSGQAFIVQGVGGTGTAEYVLELLVRV